MVGETGGLQSMGSQKAQHNLATKLQLQIPKENRSNMPIPFLKRPDTILKALDSCNLAFGIMMTGNINNHSWGISCSPQVSVFLHKLLHAGMLGCNCLLFFSSPAHLSSSNLLSHISLLDYSHSGSSFETLIRYSSPSWLPNWPWQGGMLLQRSVWVFREVHKSTKISPLTWD